MFHGLLSIFSFLLFQCHNFHCKLGLDILTPCWNKCLKYKSCLHSSPAPCGALWLCSPANLISQYSLQYSLRRHFKSILCWKAPLMLWSPSPRDYLNIILPLTLSYYVAISCCPIALHCCHLDNRLKLHSASHLSAPCSCSFFYFNFSPWMWRLWFLHCYIYAILLLPRALQMVKSLWAWFRVWFEWWADCKDGRLLLRVKRGDAPTCQREIGQTPPTLLSGGMLGMLGMQRRWPDECYGVVWGISAEMLQHADQVPTFKSVGEPAANIALGRDSKGKS